MKSDRIIKVDWDRVGEFQKFKGWNDSRLANALGHGPGYISKIKSGKSDVTKNFIQKLGSLLDMPIEGVCFFVDKNGKRIGKMGVGG